MRRLVLLTVSAAAVVAVEVAIAQAPDTKTSSASATPRMINHVGINVPDVTEAIKYYTEKMGYREAFRTYTPERSLSMAYMQISKDTFIELMGGAGSGNAPRVNGVHHYGLWVDDAKAAAPIFSIRGLTVQEPRTSTHRYTPGGDGVTGATTAWITDPYMGIIELVQPSARQRRAIDEWKPANTPNTGIRMLNHVAINVPNIEEARTYYTEKMGYKEGFRSYTAEGRLSMVYMQISKETFIELNSNSERPTGVTHYGLWVDDVKAATQMFRQRGLKVSEPMTSVHRPTAGAAEMMGAGLANIDDPYMGRIELVQISPQQQRAIANWKE